MQLDIPVDVEELLNKMSKSHNVEPAAMILQALTEYLEDLHDYEEGVKGYKRYLASGSQGTSMEDLRKELGLERA